MERDFRYLREKFGDAGAREKFEGVCYDLLKKMYPNEEVHPIRVAQGDGGIDIMIGDFNSPIAVFQCKYFLDHLGKSQKEQIQSSFKTAIENYRFSMKQWTLCIPMDMSQNEVEWWSKFKAERETNGLKITYMGEADLLHELKNYDLYNENFDIYQISVAAEPGHDSNENKEALYTYLCDRLGAMRDDHPSFRLMKRADEALFPKGKEHCLDIQADFDEQPSMPLPEIFRSSWQQEERNHLLLEGEGGIGKTVTLLSLATREGLLPEKTAAIYIPLYRLNLSDGEPIDAYIDKYVLLDAKTREADHKELDTLCSQPWEQGPKLILLLDGFNEVPYGNRFSVIEHINDWLERHPGVQMIASSRDNLRGDMAYLGKLHDIRLQKLSYSAICAYLSAAKLDVPEENDPICQVINRPLMLALYAKTSQLMGVGDPDLFWQREPYNAGKIIWNYLQSEISHMKSQHKADIEKIALSAVLCEFIVPAMAYRMVRENTPQKAFVLTGDAFDQYFMWAYQLFVQAKAANHLPLHLQRLIRKYRLSSFDAETMRSILAAELCIFKERTNEDYSIEYQLMHQDFRDCFAAIYLINITYEVDTDGSLPTPWRAPVGVDVLRFVTDLISKEQADNLWEANRRLLPTEKTAMSNMMNLQGAIWDNDFSDLDFSGLDLSDFSLYRYRKTGKTELCLPRNSRLLDSTKLSMKTFSPEGHTDTIESVVITPDGKRCISASGDATLRVWNMETGACEYVLSGHSYNVSCVAVTLDGKRCVSGSSDDTIGVWNLETGACEHILSGHFGTVNAVAITPDGKQCISASMDNTLRIWNLETGICEHILGGHTENINAVVITLDGKRCVSASDDNTLRIWNIEAQMCEYVLEGHSNSVYSVTIAPSGKRFVSSSGDNTLRIWNMETGKCEQILERKYQSDDLIFISHHVAFTPDEKHCVGAMSKNLVCIWNIETGSPDRILEGHIGSIENVTVTRDGKYCLSGAWDKTLRIWNMETGVCEHILQGHSRGVSEIVITPDGKRCISASPDKTIRVWSLKTGACEYVFEGKSEKVNAMAILPDKKRCISAFDDQTLRVWNIETGIQEKIYEWQYGDVYTMAIAPDGKQCFILSDFQTLSIWNLKSFSIKSTRKRGCVWSEPAAITPDGEISIFADVQGKIRIYDRKNRLTYLWYAEHNNTRIIVIAVTADGKRCITTVSDGTLRMWDIETEQSVILSKEYQRLKKSLAITPDGKRCIYGVGDNWIRVLNLEDGSSEEIHYGLETTIRTVAITADGQNFLSEGAGRMHYWDIEKKQMLYSVKPLFGMNIMGIDFSKADMPADVKEILRQNGTIVE